MSFKRTEEQQAICEFAVTGEDLKASAFAGCTKTTTGVEIAKDLGPNKRIWYMAFNKAIAGEATRKFPKNTKATTAHSPAYRSQVERFGGEGVFSLMPIVNAIKDDKIVYETKEAFTRGNGKRAALLVIKTLVRFCQSGDQWVGPQHIPSEFMATLNAPERINAARSVIPKAAQRLWEQLMSGPSCTIPFIPDFYLKSWVLSGPVLPWDTIFFDEAQDANGVMLQLVQDQDCQKLWVGDSHQAIYAWRGAIDALNKVDAREFSLTHSFRFGPHIATEANKVLRMLGETRDLVGAGTAGGYIVDGNCAEDASDAVLCRGNAGVLRETLDGLDAGKRVAVVGGTYEAVKQMQAAYNLSCGGRADHPEIGLFNEYDELVEFAESTEGSHLRPVVRIIEDYGDKVPDLARRLSTETVKEENNPDILISTAHKAKGREWVSVRLSEDFPSLVTEDEEGNAYLRTEEANLLYVAMTRAMQNLNLNGKGRSLAADARRLGLMFENSVSNTLPGVKDKIEVPLPSPPKAGEIPLLVAPDPEPEPEVKLSTKGKPGISPLSEDDLRAMEGWVETRYDKNDKKRDTTLVLLEMALAEIRRLQRA